MCNYNDIINTCNTCKSQNYIDKSSFNDYTNNNYADYFNDFTKYEYFYRSYNQNIHSSLSTESSNTTSTQTTSTTQLNMNINEIDDENIILYSNYTKKTLPKISLITITYNRKHLFKLPIQNYLDTKYPKENFILLAPSPTAIESYTSSTPFPHSVKS